MLKNKQKQTDNKLDDIMRQAIKSLSSLIDVNTIIGKPMITAEGKTIIPLTKVTLCFATGGGEYGNIKAFTKQSELPFAGGNGGIVSIKPTALLVNDGKNIEILQVANDAGEKLIQSVENLFKGITKNEDE